MDYRIITINIPADMKPENVPMPQKTFKTENEAHEWIKTKGAEEVTYVVEEIEVK